MYNHAYSYWNVDSLLGILCSTDFLKKQRQQQKTETVCNQQKCLNDLISRQELGYIGSFENE